MYVIKDTEAIKEIATQLYKYQNFSSSVIPQKVTSNVYKESTIKQFHSKLRSYLNLGQKDTMRVPELFWDTIAQLQKNCYGILTPPESEKARPYVRKKMPKRSSKVRTKLDQTVTRPVSTDVPQNNLSISSAAVGLGTPRRFEKIGLMNGDVLKLFDNEDQAQGYTRAYNEMRPELEFTRVAVTVKHI